MATDRDHDLVLLGATGFTGGLTAEYLARHAPTDLRWALAGRSLVKLERVRARLVEIHPMYTDLPLLVADISDPAQAETLAASTRVLATTVGPYLEYGEPVVAACAKAGTDYLDITGEPEFMDRMYVAHHQTAVESGARIVHACGFDSIPHDLGVYFTVTQLPDDVPITVRGVVRAGGTPSGGTFASTLHAMSRPKQMREAMVARRQAEPRPQGRSSRAVAGKPHRDRLLGYWLLPLPTCDPMVVARSGAALPAYGPKFRYSHFAGTKTLRYAGMGVAGVAAIGAAAQVGPLRRFLASKVPQGEGPDEARRAKSWFTVDFVAEAGDQTVRTRVSGGDPGYTETAKMLAEAAMCLASDDNPPLAGVLTPAAAMGDALLPRLQAAGIRFETRD
ncbi:saccharopine dehydrogenase family protein [Nocardioides limicola]|uniref:saccharopine dehydrogenase family protein n=1 Tax=Nocardioides limicola TaxID=2803368 RepID=UPI00193B8B01|nr:saccharopine dehydrogenase NADP-binding domain-containing protein [Nocardioides sp. DJM-14]